MEHELNLNEIPDGPSQDYATIPVGINRDGYVRFRNAQGMVDNQFWSVDAAAFLSREEVLILEDHNAYIKEVDDYISNEQKENN